MIATQHSFERAKERMSMNRKTAKRQMKLASERGKCSQDFVSQERNYLENAAFGNCIAVAYNNYCYIMDSQGNCVTLYALPKWFGKKKRYDGKELIRNLKVYSKDNSWKRELRKKDLMYGLSDIEVCKI